MHRLSLRFAWTVFFLLCVPAFASASSPFTLSTMPRVDVHAHIRDTWEVMDEYMQLRDALREQLDVEMAMRIYPHVKANLKNLGYPVE